MLKEKRVSFEELRNEIRRMQNRTGQMRWLFVQNKIEDSAVNFKKPDSEGIAWTGNWTGRPTKKFDMVAHWVAEDGRLYIGKRSTTYAPKLTKFKSPSGKDTFKIPLELIKILVVTDEDRQKASYERLLKPQGSANGSVIYTYWPKHAFDESEALTEKLSALVRGEKISEQDSNEILRSVWCRTAAHKKFKDALSKVWDGRCALTELKTTSLLVASHIKPWAKCRETPKEQICIDNGLLLASPIDQLFDKGFITFEKQGNVVLHKKGHKRFLTKVELAAFGLESHSLPKIKKAFTAANLKYLKIHTETVFHKDY